MTGTLPFVSETFSLDVATSSSGPSPARLFCRGTPQLNEGATAVNQVEKATSPGIVVLSPSLQVLHMNR